mmetsp:Transcript_17178/g.23865  ORF Transcript_17178/g.23865 Transcript_17178/m.23865 type:complete len:253 (-) Transcript_17178:339-1097(-)
MGMTNSWFSIKAEKSEWTDLYTVKASRTSSKTNPSPKSSLNHGISLSRFPLSNLVLSLSLVIIPQALARSAASLSVSDSSFGSAYSFSAGVFASSAARAASNSPLLSNPHVGDVLPISFWLARGSPVRPNEGPKISSKEDPAAASPAGGAAVPSSPAVADPSVNTPGGAGPMRASFSSFFRLPRFLPLSDAGGLHTKPISSSWAFLSGFVFTNVPWLRIALTLAPRRKPHVSSGQSSELSGTTNGCGTSKSP